MRLRALMEDIVDQLSRGQDLTPQECLLWSRQLWKESQDMQEEYHRIQPDDLPELEVEA